MRRVKLLILLGLICCIVPQKANAYLDPGTGSMIVQVIIASIVSVGCTLGIYKKKIIDFFTNKKDKND